MSEETRRGDWIQTYTGRKVYPMDVQPSDIDARDIAHALAHQCRFAGHCRFHYSVAQHSVLMAEAILRATLDADLALWALLHDATEAYLIDIPRPLKRLPEFAFYREAEKRCMLAICECFRLPAVEPAVVKVADLGMLVTEAARLMSPLHPDWMHRPPAFEALDVEIEVWIPRFAKEQFLSLLETLTAKRGER